MVPATRLCGCIVIFKAYVGICFGAGWGETSPNNTSSLTWCPPPPGEYQPPPPIVHSISLRTQEPLQFE